MPYNDTFLEAISPEGVRIRNERMRDHLVEKKCDAVCVVGCAHLYGMLNETDIKDKYHTVVFNTLESTMTLDILRQAHVSPTYIRNLEFAIGADSPISQTKSILDPTLVHKKLIDIEMIRMIHEQETKSLKRRLEEDNEQSADLY